LHPQSQTHLAQHAAEQAALVVEVTGLVAAAWAIMDMAARVTNM
jgi:hypothetical protein